MLLSLQVKLLVPRASFLKLRSVLVCVVAAHSCTFVASEPRLQLQGRLYATELLHQLLEGVAIVAAVPYHVMRNDHASSVGDTHCSAAVRQNCAAQSVVGVLVTGG